MGKMVFTILGSVAEPECSMIVERAKAGLRNARAKGKRLGQPQVIVDRPKIAALRAQGLGWKTVAECLGVGARGPLTGWARHPPKSPPPAASASRCEHAAD